MTTLATSLKELHQLHLELADVRDQITRGPQQVKRKEAELVKVQNAIAAFRDELKKLKIAADQRELSLKSGEQKVRDLQIKLNLCQSNKEFSALQEEIKNFKAANDTLADGVLELMGQQDESSKKIAERERELAAGKEELGKLKELIDYKVAKLSGRVALLEGKIVETEGTLDPGMLAEYRRLTKLRGREALAAAVDGTCSGCYTAVTPQGEAELGAGRVVFCKSCGAMLYQG